MLPHPPTPPNPLSPSPHFLNPKPRGSLGFFTPGENLAFFDFPHEKKSSSPKPFRDPHLLGGTFFEPPRGAKTPWAFFPPKLGEPILLVVALKKKEFSPGGWGKNKRGALPFLLLGGGGLKGVPKKGVAGGNFHGERWEPKFPPAENGDPIVPPPGPPGEHGAFIPPGPFRGGKTQGGPLFGPHKTQNPKKGPPNGVSRKGKPPGEFLEKGRIFFITPAPFFILKISREWVGGETGTPAITPTDFWG